jgi:hypothetical protein
MRLAALLEGGSFAGPWPAGDNGQSFGPYQIHLPAHPQVTAAQAQDADFAVRYMLPRFEDSVKGVPAEMWRENPAYAAATATYHAERPAYFYPQNRIDAAYATLTGNQGEPMATTNPNAPATPNSNSSINCRDPRNWWRPECFIDATPLGDVGRGIVNATPDSLIGGVEGLITITKTLGDSRTWWRLAFIGTGVILVIAGFVVYARPTVGASVGPVGGTVKV